MNHNFLVHFADSLGWELPLYKDSTGGTGGAEMALTSSEAMSSCHWSLGDAGAPQRKCLPPERSFDRRFLEVVVCEVC